MIETWRENWKKKDKTFTYSLLVITLKLDSIIETKAENSPSDAINSRTLEGLSDCELFDSLLWKARSRKKDREKLP